MGEKCPKCGGEMTRLRWEQLDQETGGWVLGQEFDYCDGCGHEEKVK